MAVIAQNSLTLTDWAKRQDPDSKPARIVEMLNQTNEVLTDMLWQEGNLATGSPDHPSELACRPARTAR